MSQKIFPPGYLLGNNTARKKKMAKMNKATSEHVYKS